MTTSDIAVPAWIGLPILASICALAIWKGDWPERTIGIAKPVAAVITAVFRDYSFNHIQWIGMIADIGLFFVFILVALKSDRYWPMWAAGFQLLAIVTHTAEILDSTVGAWAYITAGVIWTYLGAAALAVGVCGCIWRRMTPNHNRTPSDLADPDARSDQPS